MNMLNLLVHFFTEEVRHYSDRRNTFITLLACPKHDVKYIIYT